MKLFTLTSGLGLVVAAAAAGRPKDESICDYYTTALLKKNSAANQEALLTLVVNTAVVGNYSDVNVGIAVAGILAPGTYMGEKVNLLPYFDGSLASTNMGGKCGMSVNFLDGGGAAPLLKSMPANDKKSNQYFLLTHLYEYFAALLGCTKYGTKSKSPYAGDPSMGSVHKFMDLDAAQVGYFIEQVGLSAASFGVTKADYTAVGEALNAAFGYRCAPKVSIPSYEPAEYQSICQDCSCPVAKKPDCGAYNPVIPPRKAGAGICGPGTSCSA